MASKDYDDLLESFMNNSQKVYNDDKDDHEKNGGRLPSSYNVSSNGDRQKRDVKSKNCDARHAKGGKKKSKKAPRPVKEKPFVLRLIGGFFRLVLALLMIGGVVSLVCASVIVIYGYTFVQGDKVFDLDKEKYSQNQTSFIYAYDNNDDLVEITRLHGEENRIWLNLDEMNVNLQYAFISCEDKRFEEHHGVDWQRVGGVIVRPQNFGQGGSKITQQLIKNLTDENDVTFVRKFNEILSALNLEKHYTKDQIIEAYLNTIYLSHGCYGVKTAAETYFGKEAKDLNIAECACLAAITKAPTRYDPLLNPDQINPANGKSRRNWIIDEMYLNGFITEQECEEAKNYEMVYTNSENYQGSQIESDVITTEEATINSYYTDYVIDEVIADLQKMGYSAKKSKDMIYGGGLKIYTAIDFEIQEAIEDIYENYVKMPDETVQGACVIMDYHGRILGIVGGTGEKTGNRVFNRAWQAKRQPGSTIKPVAVYAPALEKSLNDKNTEIYWSTPVQDSPLMEVDGKKWPTNYDGGYSGNPVTIQKAIAESMNTVSARVVDMIGPSYSYDFMINRFHITTLDVFDEDYAPMATGSLTNGVSVLEMTAAYQAFGNGGYYYEPYAYYKIEDSQGNVLIEKAPENTREVALSPNTAGVMNKLLQTVSTEGTGTSFRISGVENFAKTGTTTDNKDRWVIAGTPEYLCGVWYGYDQPKKIRYSLSNNPAGVIWKEVMQNVYEVKPKDIEKFDLPEGVVQREYSPSNGKLCRGSGRYGWFDENNLPGWTTYTPPTQATTAAESEAAEGEQPAAEATTAAAAEPAEPAAEPAGDDPGE